MEWNGMDGKGTNYVGEWQSFWGKYQTEREWGKQLISSGTVHYTTRELQWRHAWFLSPQSALQPVRNPLCACLYFPVCIAARSPLSVSIFLHESMFLIPCVCLCVCLCTTKYDCTCVHISNTGFAGIKHSQWPRVLLTCNVYHHLIVSLIRM